MSLSNGSAARVSGASENQKQTSTTVTESEVDDSVVFAELRSVAVRLLVTCEQIEDGLDGPQMAA